MAIITNTAAPVMPNNIRDILGPDISCRDTIGFRRPGIGFTLGLLLSALLISRKPQPWHPYLYIHALPYNIGNRPAPAYTARISLAGSPRNRTYNVLHRLYSFYILPQFPKFFLDFMFIVL
jgi:hypothetical protein